MKHLECFIITLKKLWRQHMSSTTSNHMAPSINSFQCSRTVGRCPRPYWGCTRFPGTRLERRQEYLILTQKTAKDMLQYSSGFILKFNWVFTMVKLGQIWHFWKQPKPCFFLRPTHSHLNSLSKYNCWIINYMSVFVLWVDFSQRYFIPFLCTSAKRILNFR